ncbi:jasmonate-induced oxygenase 4 isoform X2 [Magnolia sinica]|uniref:jasmonate-induced oxygenase 4 isoform X2 n=1 Tax=Magnolia sinica TaxID=86752 RepID=UPI002659A6DF|nr:jasmonate-induced oxygenase 4 isoform X2 [Magnolia sinica]
MEVAREPQRVQALAQACLSHIPSQYIQPPEKRPQFRRKASDSGVPIIDLHSFDPNLSGDVRQKLRQSCRDWGAFQVTNHGVPQRLLNDIRAVGLSFFNSPIEEKLKYACDPNSAATEGYGSRMLSKDDSVLDWRDYFDHHTLPESRRNPSRWPEFPPNYREVVVEYSECMKVLAQKLLRMISETLSLPSLYIEEAIGEVYQNITISYYPPCPQPELALGLQAHSDMGAITLLIQDEVGGLEVLKDGEWVTVQSLSDAIVVILADQTEDVLLIGPRLCGLSSCACTLVHAPYGSKPKLVSEVHLVSDSMAGIKGGCSDHIVHRNITPYYLLL